MSEINTLILTEQFLPADGGSINWLINTYSRYDPQEVVFVASTYDGDAEIDITLPFRVIRVPMNITGWDPTQPTSFFQYLRALRRILSVVSQFGIHQIHIAKVLPEGLIAWVLSFLKPIPYVLYAHGEEILTGLSSRKFSWLMPKIYNGAAAVIANSNNTKSLLKTIGVYEEKISVIHPGVNISSFQTGDQASLRVRERYHIGHGPLLLTVGRLQRRKGQDMVIKAMPIIHKQFPDAKFLIVGSGEEESYLKNLAFEVGVHDSVIFAGRVPTEELGLHYAACDLFIMPNRDIDGDIEGFGMVYLEASAAGKPVIGGKSGGTEDAIWDGRTGLRVDGSNIEAIAEAVLRLLADPAEAKRMGEYGRRWVETEFTWDSVLNKTRNLSIQVQNRR